MLWPLTWAVIVGTLPGVIIGAWVRIECFPDPKKFKVFAGMVLLYIGARLFLDVLKNKERKKEPTEGANIAGAHSVTLVASTFRKVRFIYDQEDYEFSPLAVYLICFLVGIVGGVYGIGGGAIIAPFFVTIIRLPVYAVAGAALMGTFITSLAGVIVYQLFSMLYPNVAVAPDWLLGALFGAGGFFGMYFGARVQKHVPARMIKAILCACVLFVAIQYVSGFFK